MQPASEKQIKYFFVLCRDLGYTTEDAKERAKKKYKLEHFNEITRDQLSTLIDLLLKKAEEKDENLKSMDSKIAEAGHAITVCVSCGEECIEIKGFDEPPVCTRLRCVRKMFAGELI